MKGLPTVEPGRITPTGHRIMCALMSDGYLLTGTRLVIGGNGLEVHDFEYTRRDGDKEMVYVTVHVPMQGGR